MDMTEFEPIERKRSPELDAVLGRPFPVLNDGFVRAVDYMGSDEAIVQAARVSYGRGTKQVREDRGLIRYLLRHRHTTPFEMCEIKLHVRVPMDCWRQWIRHRTANINEYSTRYSLAIDAAQATDPDAWRLQSTANRQGSAGRLDAEAGRRFTERERAFQETARAVYNERIAAGIAREQARKDLPLSTYTEAYWKIDLSNLLHFLSLRMEANAQLEIRQYAETIGNEIVKRWVPVTWEAFHNYMRDAAVFSAQEREILRALIDGNRDMALKKAIALGWIETVDGVLRPNIEAAEFEAKLRDMGATPPWESEVRPPAPAGTVVTGRTEDGPR
jgi:thymidylate synthase (FAD)